jgi:hypothetical protein
MKPSKKQILNSIAAVANELGHTPSRNEFIFRSGISLHFILQFFPSWNTAVRTAGLPLYSQNAKIADHALLEDWGRVARKNRSIFRTRARLPRSVYLRQGKYNPHTFANRFGNWAGVPLAFRRFADGKRKWTDVLALIPPPGFHSSRSRHSHSRLGEIPSPTAPSRQLLHRALKDRTSYGNPTNFLGLRYEPVNEQGVVLLFGMLANHLGYKIEAMQTGFPDCEAIRLVAPNRWQRVHIEFEFESKNYRDHAHPTTGCDVIVCWRHNWPKCPSHIEVLELSSHLKSLADPED